MVIKMAIENVRKYMQQFGIEDRIMEFDVSSATVELAAQALHCEPGRIAKTLSFMVEEQPILIVTAGDMKIDCDSRNLYIAGRPINLTAKEFDLLELLAVNPGKVYSRDNLLKAVWGQDYSGDGRTVDVHMRRLREKIEDNPSEPKYVHTKWGVGYYFNV